MTLAWELFKRIAPGLFLALAFAACVFGSWQCGAATERTKLTTAHKLVLAERDKALFSAKADLLAQKLDLERQHTDAMAAVQNDFQRTNDEATKRISALDAAVRAGDVRLRQRFTCPAVPAAGGGKAGTSAPRGDAGAAGGLQDADVQFLLRIADDADAVVRQLTACQAVVRKDRVQ